MIYNIYLMKGILRSSTSNLVLTFDNVTIERYNYYEILETPLNNRDFLQSIIEFQ